MKFSVGYLSAEIFLAFGSFQPKILAAQNLSLFCFVSQFKKMAQDLRGWWEVGGKRAFSEQLQSYLFQQDRFTYQQVKLITDKLLLRAVYLLDGS